MGDGVAALVVAAAGGSAVAWDALVDRYSGLVWAVARAHRLERQDAADVAQTTWLRLVEHLDEIRDPSRVGSWLATTAARESLRVLRRRGREEVTDATDEVGPLAAEPSWAASEELSGPERAVLDDERDREVRDALAAIPERCRRLLLLLAADPPPSYAEIGAALDMPVGSIGPTRARCLACLRHELARGPAPAPA